MAGVRNVERVPRLRATRRGVLVAVAASAALPFAGAVSPSAAADATEIGAPEAGRTAFSLLGKIEQHGDDFMAYGYLTAVDNLDVSTLFDADSPAERNETTARLTFLGGASRSGHFVLDRLFVVHAAGDLSIYAGDTGGANFDEPNSFGRGDPVATATMLLEGVVVEVAAATGVTTQTVDLEVAEVNPFSLGGESYQFGHVGLVLRGTLTGKGTLVAASKEGHPELPHGEIVAAGSAVVVQ